VKNVVENNQFLTLREKIYLILLERKELISVREIMNILNMDRRDEDLVYTALQHLAKTIKRRSQGKQELVMIPPTCISCGYVFKDLDKPRKPSKCPRCRSERISEPMFMIREK